MNRLFVRAAFVAGCLLVAACGSSPDESAPTGPFDAGGAGAAGSDGDVPDVVPDAPDAGSPPPAEFARFCKGGDWRKTFVPATVGKTSGAYKGYVNATLDPGVQEGAKVIPEHPFAATKIRVAFAKGEGTARIRLVNTFGRSYPASFPKPDWPDYKEPIDLVEPVDLDVKDASQDKWFEVPIPETLLLPTQHYMILYEHVAADPRLAIDDVGAGDLSRSLIFFPDKPSDPPAGAPGNYRMHLEGATFCAWKDEERDFGYSAQPFSDVDSGWAAFADLDADGHDDLILAPATGPKAFLGDGKGKFAAAPFDPFPDAPKANFLLFGDLDNDGALDAFASTYVQTDGDGDGVGVDKDCDDTDAAVKPGATETPNGKDDDCDGKADDGTDTADKDGDGKSIAQGDCDDTRKDVAPGLPELLDGRDNDCDGKTDEDFVPRILIGDGTGKMKVVPNPDVESIGPSSAAALGDGNGDGLIDIYAGYWLVHYPDFPSVPSRYYEGQGKGAFAHASAKAGIAPKTWRPVYGVLWTDWNDDGKLDVYVSNYQLSDNMLWKNLGGTFTDVAVAAGAAHDDVKGPYTSQYPGGHSFGSDTGDIDNDGDPDIYVPNISHPRVQPWSDPSMLLVNQGGPDWKFLNRRREMGLSYDEGDVNCAFGDYDNDGDLDLVVVSTYPSHFPRLYRNDGAAGFVDVTYETHTNVHMSQTAVWADVDEDGDLDLVITSPGPGPKVNLLVNRVGTKNHFVEIDLVGTKSNRHAVGARVLVTTGATTRMREVTAISRHQGSRRVHFGLGQATAIDKLVVRWPSGATETIAGAAPDARWRIVEGSGKAEKP